MTIARFNFFSCFISFLFLACLWITFLSMHHFWHVLYDLQSCGVFIDSELHEKAIFLLSVTACPSHHQCLTWLWPWSSVSSHTLNAGCLAPSRGSQLLLACFACLVSWCSPWFSCLCGGGGGGVGVCLQKSCCYWCICVIGLSQQRFQWLCDTVVISPQYLLCSLPSWLKPYWYSAHRYMLIQMRPDRMSSFTCS